MKKNYLCKLCYFIIFLLILSFAFNIKLLWRQSIYKEIVSVDFNLSNSELDTITTDLYKTKKISVENNESDENDKELEK